VGREALRQGKKEQSTVCRRGKEEMEKPFEGIIQINGGGKEAPQEKGGESLTMMQGAKKPKKTSFGGKKKEGKLMIVISCGG